MSPYLLATITPGVSTSRLLCSMVAPSEFVAVMPTGDQSLLVATLSDQPNVSDTAGTDPSITVHMGC